MCFRKGKLLSNKNMFDKTYVALMLSDLSYTTFCRALVKTRIQIRQDVGGIIFNVCPRYLGVV